MLPSIENFFSGFPSPETGEVFETIAGSDAVRIERIVSGGQATPEGHWLDQEQDEWVLLLAGSAEILFAGDSTPRRLVSGDYLLIPARCRHRVTWTAPDCHTIWLAVHFAPALTS